MKRKYLIAAISTLVILLIAVLAYFIFTKEQASVEDAELAPDGKPYNVLVDGMYYTPEMYDIYFGHASDNILSTFEDQKPDWLDGINFPGVTFPAMEKDVRYFPAFVVREAIRYKFLPEDVLRAYLPEDIVEFQLRLEHEGLVFEGVASPYAPETAPDFLGISTQEIEPDIYRVIYVTSTGNIIRHFAVADGKIVEEVERSW